jgi:hypothetical protein
MSLPSLFTLLHFQGDRLLAGMTSKATTVTRMTTVVVVMMVMVMARDSNDRRKGGKKMKTHRSAIAEYINKARSALSGLAQVPQKKAKAQEILVDTGRLAVVCIIACYAVIRHVAWIHY